MEIIGESAHRLLAYVEAVRRQGYALTTTEFKAYAAGWDQKVTVSGYTGEWAEIMENMSRLTSSVLGGSGRKELEPMIDYLSRVRWIEVRNGTVNITTLGKAVLREANAPLPDSDVGSTLEVVIDPENPFAYAQLMSKIAGFEDCFIVDPFLDQDQLLTLATFPTVTRILTGNKHSRTKVPAFGMVLQAAPHLQVRMVEQGKLHDRIAMPAVGSALMLGSSLNSIARRFGVATSLEETSSRLILDNYNSIWADATPIEPTKLEPPVTTTDATVDEGTGS